MKLQTPETEITPSFARYLLERKDTLGLSDEEMAYMAGSLFGGGTNTTAATIGWGIMAAALHPEAQEKVWEEIDRVVGRDRPPTFADQKSLVWVTAWVLEVMRWRPVSAGGFPHKATEDIVWVSQLGALVSQCHISVVEWLSNTQGSDYLRQCLVCQS